MKKSKKTLQNGLRQIQIETGVSANGKRKSLRMTEIINKDGFLARAEKKYHYYVSEKTDQSTLKMDPCLWDDLSSKSLKQKTRRVSIQRIFDEETGIGKTSCRTTGSFYVNKDNRVFAIAFMHIIRFDLLGPVE